MAVDRSTNKPDPAKLRAAGKPSKTVQPSGQGDRQGYLALPQNSGKLDQVAHAKTIKTNRLFLECSMVMHGPKFVSGILSHSIPGYDEI